MKLNWNSRVVGVQIKTNKQKTSEGVWIFSGTTTSRDSTSKMLNTIFFYILKTNQHNFKEHNAMQKGG